MNSAQIRREMTAAVDHRLDDLLAGAPSEARPDRLIGAMRHAALAPGKRLRPMLTMLIAESGGATRASALDVGCAGEMVHAASLILDDLPSMDDARTRRGRACAHIAFDEATAILAATALLNKAYAVIARAPDVAADIRLEIVALLSDAIGESGLIGGQYGDLFPDAEARPVAIAEIYARKTGALFDFAMMSGAALSGMSESSRAALKTVSRHLGLAFQIHDDLLDQSATCGEAMKDVRQDDAKTTYLGACDPADLKIRIAKRKGAAMSALSEAGLAAEIFEGLVAEQFDLAIARAR